MQNNKFKIIAVDIQNDFTEKEGKHYTLKPSLDFLKENVFPYLNDKKIKIAEIISDYRQPRPGDLDESCIPGSWGYESNVPAELVNFRWIKCMNSPLWTRENIGNPNAEAGLPFQDPKKLGQWLDKAIGNRDEIIPVLIGLTADCCVLSTAQELRWRGYYPLVIKEGVDHYSGKEEDKEQVLKNPVSNWAKVVSWEDIKEKL